MTANRIKITPPELGEPYLLTPGPLTTSFPVKQAMLRDWGSWDDDFRAMTREMRTRLLALLGPGGEDFDCVPMQGSGSFCVEAMLGSFIPRDGKALVLANGAYGQRSALSMKYLGRDYTVLDKGDYLPPRGDEVAQILADDPAITHVVAIHCETSSGILNPVEEISEATYAAGRKLLGGQHVGLWRDRAESGGCPVRSDGQLRQQMYRRRARLWLYHRPAIPSLEAAKGNSHSLSRSMCHAQWEHI